MGQKLWDDKKDEALIADVKAELATALAEAEASPAPDMMTVLDHTYAKYTPQLEWERKELAAELGV